MSHSFNALVLRGAYGRKFKTEEELREAWSSGMVDFGHRGRAPYISGTDRLGIEALLNAGIDSVVLEAPEIDVVVQVSIVEPR